MSDMEHVERGRDESPPAEQRIWFHVEEVEIRWLPCGEAAFLLWVLVALLAAWLLIGVALGVV
jgi:hypothetical protein